jgi:hypothetical protein
VAYIRRRASKNGSVSTTLVESYRDDQGRPRERVLANLHGESTSLDALAKLTVQIEELRTHRDELIAAKADYGFVMSYVARKLAILEQERAIIVAHCRASKGELRAAIRPIRNGSTMPRRSHRARCSSLGSIKTRRRS